MLIGNSCGAFYTKKKSSTTETLICREEATRTPDPHVPNVVRYQLRYFSKCKALSRLQDMLAHFRSIRLFARANCLDYEICTKAGAKIVHFLHLCK